MFYRTLKIFSVLAIIVTISIGQARAEQAQTLILSTGEVGGYYLPVGAALCRIAAKGQEGLRCLIEPTAGSGANLQMLGSGETDLALTQSRALWQAFKGEGAFAEAGANEDLRALFSLYAESLVVLVRKDGAIKDVEGLKGKRVNLGPQGTFQRYMADSLIEAQGWKVADFTAMQSIDSALQGKALCNGEIDAAFYVGIHPLSDIAQTIRQCGAKPLPLKSKAIDIFLAKNPFLSSVHLGSNSYEGWKEGVPTFGVRTVVAASKHLPQDQVYGFVKTIFQNLSSLSAIHPALQSLNKDHMAIMSIPVPLHDGAARYFREEGIGR